MKPRQKKREDGYKNLREDCGNIRSRTSEPRRAVRVEWKRVYEARGPDHRYFRGHSGHGGAGREQSPEGDAPLAGARKGFRKRKEAWGESSGR